MSKQPHDVWYTSYRWRQRRLRQLRRKPLCELCERIGVIKVAEIAHHITPHKGNADLFWRGELQSVCKEHHDRDLQSIERGGKPRPVIGADGWPVSPDEKIR